MHGRARPASGRWTTALALVMALSALVVGCTDDDGGAGDTSTSAASEPTTATSGPPATEPPLPTSPASTPATAEGDGWSLGLSTAGPAMPVGGSMALCYQITGTVREPVLALDVSVVDPVSSSMVHNVSIDVSVGRGVATLDLTPVPDGTYTVRVVLVVDGQPVPGATVDVPGVTVVAGAAPGTCG